MRLYIKNMVSYRCKLLLKNELEKMGITDAIIELGYVDIQPILTEGQKKTLNEQLRINGLELIENKKIALAERIKNIIIDMIHHNEKYPEVNYSNFITDQLHHDYCYLSNLFSEVEGRSIQKFIILHKIEKAKELIMYNEYNLTEISYKLNYSSVAHLSNQFKKITGYSPRLYKKQHMMRTRVIEQI